MRISYAPSASPADSTEIAVAQDLDGLRTISEFMLGDRLTVSWARTAEGDGRLSSPPHPSGFHRGELLMDIASSSFFVFTLWL